MAEGFGRAYAPPGVRVFSAGTLAAGVHPLAVEAMAEIGIDISGQRSKRLDEISAGEVDVVVTLCDDAAQSCPFFPGELRRIHHAVRDPILATGSHDDRVADFRRARDEIGPFVRKLMDDIAAGSLP